jgi:hypothetical protein
MLVRSDVLQSEYQDLKWAIMESVGNIEQLDIIQ